MSPPPLSQPALRPARPPGPLVIEIDGVTKLYQMGAETIHALCGIALRIHRNEYLAVMGPSGSGKTKIEDLRDATADLIDELMPSGPSARKLRIGIAPFTSGVNAGSFLNAVDGGRSDGGSDGGAEEDEGEAMLVEVVDAPGAGFLGEWQQGKKG